MANTDNLQISGIGFGTLEEILPDKDIANHIAELITVTNSTFKITFIFPQDATKRTDLKGQSNIDIGNNIDNGHKLIKKFIENIIKSVEIKMTKKKFDEFYYSIDKYIELLYYKENILPRHFILQGRDKIFFGSYFSYYKGSDSYLLCLQQIKKGGGLFNAFKTEAEYICNESKGNVISCAKFTAQKNNEIKGPKL